MSLTERPKWRMTRCEAQVILDLEALNRALRAPERWVPEPLITLLMSARKGGRPHVTLRTLRSRAMSSTTRPSWPGAEPASRFLDPKCCRATRPTRSRKTP